MFRSLRKLADSAKENREKREQYEYARAAAVTRLQAEAEADHLERERKQQEEEGLFDPLAADCKPEPDSCEISRPLL